MTSMKLISQGISYDVSRRDEGLYEVVSGEVFLGFVERAGQVYVALSGIRYDRAVETGQALSLSGAAAMLEAAPAARVTQELVAAA
ncbi:hypothetical protein [Herbiconiux flava]|uniref:Uncharacterized protein n=1 Tax=Herbiconiux flava TaxID=881268 RepID=A0A852SKM2_9MICO|nr:hypothetical protein [Herbiconiux flava]NYD68961.1 hypothetical protein [Herbiconiux flava]GLK15709.1 hypothetical protein GCM10017602_01910 [Herbiconiux flava]